MSNTWLLGPVLQDARERLGISKREAARRASISEQLWRRLETGYYTVQGERIPLTGRDGKNKGASADTVRAAALAVGMDVREALALVGYSEDVFDEAPLEKAEKEFKKLYDVFEDAWGPDIARIAMRNVQRRRDGEVTPPPDRTNGSTDSATG